MIIPNENNPQNPTALIDCVYFVIIKFKSPSSIKHITFYRWFFYFLLLFFVIVLATCFMTTSDMFVFMAKMYVKVIKFIE